MLRILLGCFVAAHGLVTAAIWTAPRPADAPFDAGHSWLLGDARPFAMAIALLAGVGLVIAGVGVLADTGWWGVFGVTAGPLALLLMLVYFNPWLLAGIAISVGVVYASSQALGLA
jgi:hypothetical protein